ncbi:MAG: type IV pilin N-terminal domain-containing protein [Methanoregulaceae archaeon]
MQYLRKWTVKNGEAAVSPVVGVMLMLVVTIIIAAVVSGFAGNTVSGKDKAPSANVEFHIRNGGDNTTSYFTMKVLAVSEPIATKNLKMITSWMVTNSTSGNTTIGGGTSYLGSGGVKVPGETGPYTGSNITVPTGYGTGVTDWANDTYHPLAAQWGHFSLSSGTMTFDKPTKYGTTGDADAPNYNYSSDYLSDGTIDPMQAILGSSWNDLRQGDTVNVRILDTQSGKIIVDQNVVVER